MSTPTPAATPQGAAPAVVPKPQPPPYVPKSKLLRFFGINVRTLLDFAPSRKTGMYLTLAASPIAFYFYDRRCAEAILKEYKDKVAHLADTPMPDHESGDQDALLHVPRKIWIMTSRVPDDFEDDRPSRWFKTYIKPVLFAAGYDYSFLNGTAPGAIGRRIRDQIRTERVASLAPQANADPVPGEANYLESLDRRRHARAMGLTVVVGRNTLKEYFWGFKHGWCTDFDAVQHGRGEEGKLQDLKEELDKDGSFDVRPSPELPSGEAMPDGDATQTTEPGQASTSSLFAPRSSYSFLSRNPSSPISPSPTTQDAPEQRSLIVSAASEIPAQPPLLFLPYDHPLGYLRHWPLKMVKYLFCERYRVQHGCEAALAIINATQPDSPTASYTFEDSDVRKGFRRLQGPRDPSQVQTEDDRAAIEDVLTENKKKLRSEYGNDDLPESGSRDLDADYYAEYHYRKTYGDTPANIVNGRKTYYEELPGRLQIAREIENRDRLPTKEEQKYPPPTESELRTERLNKEKKWRNDFAGWLITRKGSKVTWDPRFESFRVLDLELAAQSMQKYGFAGDRRQSVNSEFI